MRKSYLTVCFAVSVSLFTGSSVLAQTKLRGPLETPPSDYAQDQYIDSAGCIFVRLERDSKTLWIPRVAADKSQLCGQPKEAARDPEQRAEALAAVDAAHGDPLSDENVTCYSDAPVPQRFYLPEGGSLILCTLGDGDIGKAKLPFNSQALQGQMPKDIRGARLTPYAARDVEKRSGETSLEDRKVSYYLQIGTFSQVENAEAALGQIESIGYSGKISPEIIAGNAVNVVSAGPFVDQPKLGEARRALAGLGYKDAFVIVKSQ